MKTIDEIRSEIESFQVENAENLEQFRLQFLSKKSEIQSLFGQLKNMAQEDRKEFGQLVNDLRDLAQNHYNEFKSVIEAAATPSRSASSFWVVLFCAISRFKFEEMMEPRS